MNDILRSIDLRDMMSQARLRAAEPLPASFYRRKTPEVARELLGKCIVHRVDGKYVAGIIVETEAYLASDDAASHSACGMTARNASMFASGGTCYVYLSYGINHCMNVVTGPAGIGEAVLIRALRPVSLAGDMLRRRALNAVGQIEDWPRSRVLSICNGPGKLTAALGIALGDDRRDFFGPGLKIIGFAGAWQDSEVVVGPRVGISKATDLPLRFHIGGCPWVSRGPARTVQARKHF